MSSEHERYRMCKSQRVSEVISPRRAFSWHVYHHMKGATSGHQSDAAFPSFLQIDSFFLRVADWIVCNNASSKRKQTSAPTGKCSSEKRQEMSARFFFFPCSFSRLMTSVSAVLAMSVRCFCTNRTVMKIWVSTRVSLSTNYFDLCGEQ